MGRDDSQTTFVSLSRSVLSLAYTELAISMEIRRKLADLNSDVTSCFINNEKNITWASQSHFNLDGSLVFSIDFIDSLHYNSEDIIVYRPQVY